MTLKKSIQLTTGPLEELLKHGESLDFRLDEAAWQELAIGDVVEFWEDLTGWQTESSKTLRRALVRIEHIYRAPGFRELFDLIESDSERLGDKDALLTDLRSWWSEDKETTAGVLAFHVMLIK